jgi:putative transposase
VEQVRSDIRGRHPPAAREPHARFRHWQWNLDEMYVEINGELMYLWRAVDHEGEILESLCHQNPRQGRRAKVHAQSAQAPWYPEVITTDGNRSYGAAMNELGNRHKQEIRRWANDRAENCHLPLRRRERAMLRFRRMTSLQKFTSVMPTSTSISSLSAISSTETPTRTPLSCLG